MWMPSTPLPRAVELKYGLRPTRFPVTVVLLVPLPRTTMPWRALAATMLPVTALPVVVTMMPSPLLP